MRQLGSRVCGGALVLAPRCCSSRCVGMPSVRQARLSCTHFVQSCIMIAFLTRGHRSTVACASRRRPVAACPQGAAPSRSPVECLCDDTNGYTSVRTRQRDCEPSVPSRRCGLHWPIGSESPLSQQLPVASRTHPSALSQRLLRRLPIWMHATRSNTA